MKIHENEEEDEKNEEKEDEEENLTIPGSSYVKLMALTSISVLPGALNSSVIKSHLILWH